MSNIGSTLKNLRALIQTFPKYTGSVALVSPTRIYTQVQRWRTALPHIDPYYAVKCNPNPILLDNLSRAHVGFDCASLQEINDIKNLRWQDTQKRPDTIYAHPMKSEKDILLVDSMNIETTVVDSVEECIKLDTVGWKGSALVRVAVDDKESDMPFSSKFGASLDEVKHIAKVSKIPLIGISFHVGSGCKNPGQYASAILYSYTLFGILRQHGHLPSMIDIGGGFSSSRDVFWPMAEAIRTISLPEQVRMIAEPGRYFAQPSQDLFVRVIAKKPGLGGKGWRYVIDESVYSYFSCIPFDKQQPSWLHLPANPKTYQSSKMQDSVIFGRTCDSLDVIAKGNMKEMQVGDWLYFPLMGAYTNSTASEFNGFPKPLMMTDVDNLLPDIDTTWKLKDAWHASKLLTYSSSLV
jgi:ornithine decarboxylase